MDIRRQYGLLICEARLANGLSQEELAFAANISVVYLSRIENGDGNPTLAVIHDLAVALGRHPGDFISRLRLRKGSLSAPKV